MKQLLCRVVNDDGVPFNVVVSDAENSVWGHYYIVTFYDDRYHSAATWKEFGQQVSQYTMKTLLDNWEGHLGDVRFCLHGGVPAWYVTGDNMARVFAAIAKFLHDLTGKGG